MSSIKRMDENDAGQGLAYVLVVSAVLLLLGTVLVQMLRQEMTFTIGTGKRTVMLHAADAALDRAMYALQVGGNWDAIPQGIVSGYKQDITYTDVPDVRYTIRIQAGNWTPGVQTGDTENERTVTVFVRNSVSGELKKVQAVLLLSSINSALFTGGQAHVSGSADIHWGPIVSYSTASDAIPNPQNWEDHPVFMSVGGITLNNKGSASSQGLNCPDPVVGQCVCEYCTSLGTMPIVPVDTFRKTALAQNADGKHYYGPYTTPSTFTCGQVVTPDLPVAMDEEDVVFFDTADGKNFNPDTDTVCKAVYGGGDDRGADIKFTDGCGKGTLIVLGNLWLSGNGGCPTISMIAPSDCDKLEADPVNCVNKLSDKLFWNGFVYIANDLHSSGTQQIYGSIYSYDSSDVKGNFSIYYKSDTQSAGYFGKNLLVKVWLERGPSPGDVFP